MMSDGVTIAMGFDGGYAPHAAAALASIARNAPDARLRCLMLHDGVDRSVQRRIESVAPAAEFVWLPIGDDDVPEFAARAHFTRATLFRLALEELAPLDCRRVIYLDVDVAVVDDVRKLWAERLEGCLVGAVPDDEVDATAFAARWGLASPGAYFNAGVLLIDLERIRSERIFSKAMQFISANGRDLPWNDQDALNWACWGRWRQLDTVWNVQRGAAIAYVNGAADRLGGKEPRIIHFTGADKPWVADTYHPWSWLYWRNLRRTPFAHDVGRRAGIGRMRRFRLWARWMRRWNYPRPGVNQPVRNATS